MAEDSGILDGAAERLAASMDWICGSPVPDDEECLHLSFDDEGDCEDCGRGYWSIHHGTSEEIAEARKIRDSLRGKFEARTAR